MRNPLSFSVFIIYFAGYLMFTPSVMIRLNCQIADLVLRTQNQVYRLSSVRNDLHIAEFFEPIFAEFNADP